MSGSPPVSRTLSMPSGAATRDEMRDLLEREQLERSRKTTSSGMQ